MRGRRHHVTLLLATLGVPGEGSSAQVAPNRATTYLAATDVSEARALWVNPAGLAARASASVLLELTVVRPGRGGRLGQVSAGLNSRGVAFGYQRDNFANGADGHTYRWGLALGAQGLTAGVALAWYRGGTSATGWDLGLRYDWGPPLSVGGVVRDVGQPVVRGTRLEATFVPSVTLRPLADRLALSAEGAFASSASRGYAFEARAAVPIRVGLGLLARLDTDRRLRRRTLAVGVSLGGADQVGIVATHASRLDALSAYGASSRTLR